MWRMDTQSLPTSESHSSIVSADVAEGFLAGGHKPCSSMILTSKLALQPSSRPSRTARPRPHDPARVGGESLCACRQNGRLTTEQWVNPVTHTAHVQMRFTLFTGFEVEQQTLWWVIRGPEVAGLQGYNANVLSRALQLLHESFQVIKSSDVRGDCWWSVPGPPQTLADRADLRRALLAVSLSLSLSLLGSSLKLPLSWNFIRMSRTPHAGRPSIQSVLGFLPQHPKNGFSVWQGAGGGPSFVGSPLDARGVRVWAGKASSKRRVQSRSEPQAVPLRPQEVSGSLQAGGDAVLERAFLASTAVTASSFCFVSFGDLLEEEDCVLQYLSFLHSALRPTLEENINMSYIRKICGFLCKTTIR